MRYHLHQPRLIIIIMIIHHNRHDNPHANPDDNPDQGCNCSAQRFDAHLCKLWLWLERAWTSSGHHHHHYHCPHHHHCPRHCHLCPLRPHRHHIIVLIVIIIIRRRGPLTRWWWMREWQNAWLRIAQSSSGAQSA